MTEQEVKAVPPTFKAARKAIVHAFGSQNVFSEYLVLKGGTLMHLAYASGRYTTDIDYSCTWREAPSKFESELLPKINEQLMLSVNAVGVAGLVVRLQKVERKPKPAGFDEKQFPALKLKFAYALRGSPDHIHLERGQCSQTIEVDISFRENVCSGLPLRIESIDASVPAYSPQEVFAEKIRALLQQQMAGRGFIKARRQDIYDLNYLIEHSLVTDSNREDISSMLYQKCESKGVEIDRYKFSDTDFKQLCTRGWESMQLGLSVLPEFDDCYERVKLYYETLFFE